MCGLCGWTLLKKIAAVPLIIIVQILTSAHPSPKGNFLIVTHSSAIEFRFIASILQLMADHSRILTPDKYIFFYLYPFDYRHLFLCGASLLVNTHFILEFCFVFFSFITVPLCPPPPGFFTTKQNFIKACVFCLY